MLTLRAINSNNKVISSIGEISVVKGYEININNHIYKFVDEKDNILCWRKQTSKEPIRMSLTIFMSVDKTQNFTGPKMLCIDLAKIHIIYNKTKLFVFQSKDNNKLEFEKVEEIVNSSSDTSFNQVVTSSDVSTRSQEVSKFLKSILDENEKRISEHDKKRKIDLVSDEEDLQRIVLITKKETKDIKRSDVIIETMSDGKKKYSFIL
jgi:hypothetical protein